MNWSWLVVTKAWTVSRSDKAIWVNPPLEQGREDTESQDGDGMKMNRKYISKRDSKTNYSLKIRRINTVVIKYWVKKNESSGIG